MRSLPRPGSRPFLALLAALAVLLPVGAAAAFARFHVSGPRKVRVGHEVRFRARGLEPHARITVNLAPTINRGGNCCGIDVVRRARADADGRAVLRFRWPRTYWTGDERVRWTRGTRADVLVMTDGGRGRKVVRIR